MSNPRRTRIWIKPESFGVPQRVEALAKATELGQGLVMELHNAHTEFYADPSVEVGKIAVYAPPAYKAQPEYVTTLDSPTDHYDPWGDRLRADRRTPGATEPDYEYGYARYGTGRWVCQKCRCIIDDTAEAKDVHTAWHRALEGSN